jgi:hypothetical protein
MLARADLNEGDLRQLSEAEILARAGASLTAREFRSFTAEAASQVHIAAAPRERDVAELYSSNWPRHVTAAENPNASR